MIRNKLNECTIWLHKKLSPVPYKKPPLFPNVNAALLHGKIYITQLLSFVLNMQEL